VARSSGAPVDEVFRAAAASLAGFSDDPVSLVTACRRLIERHPENGPVWWLCARVLSAGDPGDESWRCLDAWVADRTPSELGHALPDGAVVALVGSPDRFIPALSGRGDVRVVVVDVEGDSYGFVRRLDAVDVVADTVDVARLGPAVSAADLVVLDAASVGPAAGLAAPGSWPVAAVAHTSGVPVWLVAGTGRVMAPNTWDAIADRTEGSSSVDRLARALVDRVVGESGPQSWDDAMRRGDMPDVAELRR
jgi:hypothetical protein